jgi:hypothetical protein
MTGKYYPTMAQLIKAPVLINLKVNSVMTSEQ